MAQRFGDGDLICDRFLLGGQIGVPGKAGYAMNAHDTLTGDDVVCKIALQPKTTADDFSRREFLEQYRKLKAIRLRDFVAVEGYFEHATADGSYPVLVLERGTGTVFDDWARQRPVLEIIQAVARAATVLAALHEVGLTHGDLSAGNVLVGAGRVLLIDPEPELWGSSCNPNAEIFGDIASLGSLIRRSLPADSLGQLHPLLARLEAKDCEPPSARVVAGELWAIAQAPDLSDESRESLRLFAESYLRKRSERASAFRDLLQTRDLQVEAFVERIKPIAAEFQIAPTFEVGEGPAAERRSAETNPGKGKLMPRWVVCKNTEDEQDMWDVTFDADLRNDFKKPWPYGEQGLIAKGSSFVRYESVGLLSETIEIRLGVGGVPEISVVQKDGSRALLTDKWIREHLLMIHGEVRKTGADSAPRTVAAPRQRPLGMSSAAEELLEGVANTYVMAKFPNHKSWWFMLPRDSGTAEEAAAELGALGLIETMGTRGPDGFQWRLTGAGQRWVMANRRA